MHSVHIDLGSGDGQAIDVIEEQKKKTSQPCMMNKSYAPMMHGFFSHKHNF